MSKLFKIAFEKSTENVATEGVKGAVIGGAAGLILGPGLIVTAIIGHFWQEYLIEKEKNEKLLLEKIKNLKNDEAKPGVKQKLEVLEFKLKKNKEELKEIKNKAKEEEANNKKIEEAKKKQKVAKEELTEEVPVEETPAETPADEPAADAPVVESEAEETPAETPPVDEASIVEEVPVVSEVAEVVATPEEAPAEAPTPVEEVPATAEVVATPEGDAGVAEDTSEEDKATEISIEELTEEIGRQEELADGLDALKTIATVVETPSVTDVALFRVAANMAVAGTDEEAQEFIPAIESNKPIDIKSFDAKIKIIKDKIATLKVELAALEAKKKIK